MGMLPILLALAGFVLLWAIVNYNSLLSKKASAEAFVQHSRKLTSRHKELWQELSGLLAPNGFVIASYLSPSPGDFHEITQLKTQLAQIERLKADTHPHPALQSNLSFTATLKELEENTINLYKSQARLLSITKSYNQQVQRMPYRIIAVLFAFKTMHIANTPA